MNKSVERVFLKFIEIIKTHDIEQVKEILWDNFFNITRIYDSNDNSIVYHITLNFSDDLPKYEQLLNLLLERGGLDFITKFKGHNYASDAVKNTVLYILKNNLYEQFSVLVKLGYDVGAFVYCDYKHPQRSYNILHCAVLASNYHFVNYLLSNYNQLVNSINSEGNTSFYLTKDIKILNLLKEYGGDVTIPDKNGYDILSLVFKYDDVDYFYVEDILKNNIIQFYTRMKNNTNPLINILRIHKNEVLIKRIIKQHPPQSKADTDEISNLFMFIFMFDLPINDKFIKFLIKKGAEINCCIGETCALKNAVSSNSVEKVQYLINLGAKTNYPCKISHPNQEIIFPALCNNNVEIVTILLENGARFDKIYTGNNSKTTFLFEITSLDHSYEEKFLDLIIKGSKSIIDFKISFSILNANEEEGFPCISALSKVLFYENVNYAKKLIENGASLEEPIFDKFGKFLYNSPLHFIMSCNDDLDFLIPFFEFLYHYKKRNTVFSGVYIYRNIVNKLPGPHGECTLFYVLGKSKGLFHFLLKHGADPNCMNSNGELILQKAFFTYFSYFKMLMEFGADPLKKNGNGINSIDLLVTLKNNMKEGDYDKVYSLFQNRTQSQLQRVESKKYYNPDVTFYFDH